MVMCTGTAPSPKEFSPQRHSSDKHIATKCDEISVVLSQHVAEGPVIDGVPGKVSMKWCHVDTILTKLGGHGLVAKQGLGMGEEGFAVPEQV